MNYIFPLSKYITITQAFKGVSVHAGIDFGWNSTVPGGNGQAIIAAEEGEVVSRADGYGNTYPKNKIYGNYVIIAHPDGNYTVYGHLQKGVPVYVGNKVKKGQVIGYMGNTGYSNGQHLHFEFRKGKNQKSSAVDPLNYLMYEDKNIVIGPKSDLRDKIKFRQTTTPVERNTKVDQINVKITNLYARTEPGTSKMKIGFVNPGYYNVLDTAEANGYTWYNCGAFWCAKVSGVDYLEHDHVTYTFTAPRVDEDIIPLLRAFAEEHKFAFTIKDN